jgi:hypothetical protein
MVDEQLGQLNASTKRLDPSPPRHPHYDLKETGSVRGGGKAGFQLITAGAHGINFSRACLVHRQNLPDE